MERLSREALLGATDLIEKEVELPTIGGAVLIRSLPAEYSNQASSEALEMVNVTVGGRQKQTAHINTVKLEQLQVLHALVDPKLNSLTEVGTFAKRCGPAWHTLVAAIDEISGIDKGAIERANAEFRDGVSDQGAGSGRSDVAAGDCQSDVPA